MILLFKKIAISNKKIVYLFQGESKSFISLNRFFSTAASADTNEEEGDDTELLEILQASTELGFNDIDEEYDLDSTGFVVTLGDGIAKIEGLYKVGLGELLSFESGETGMVLGIETEYVSAVVFGNYENIKQDHAVFGLGLDVGVEAGVHLLGKVVNALGESLDPSDPVLVPDDEDENDDEESLLVQ
jgi:F0F1-type ATP synthase alpha subunit